MATADDDVQMDIDETAGEDVSAASKVEEKEETTGSIGITPSPHLLIGSAFGVKVPPPEYSGIPQDPAEQEQELAEVKEEGQGDGMQEVALDIESEPVVQRKPPKSKSKKKKNKEGKDDPLIMPLISAPPSIVANPPSRITGPIELDPDDYKDDREMGMGQFHGQRNKGSRIEERGHMDDRSRMMEDRGRMGDGNRDDDHSPGRGGRGWQRPRHGKYKYPDDFDEEDFEEEFGDRDYGRDRDRSYGREYDDFGPPHDRGRAGPPGRDFGPGPRPPYGQRPNYPGPPHHHGPPPPGYAPRNFGPEGPYGPDGPGNFGPPGYGPGPMMGPRGPPPMGPGGPPMGPGGPMGPTNFPPHGYGPGPQGPGYHEGFQGPPGPGFPPHPQGPGAWQGEGFPPPPPQPNFNMPQPPQTFSGEVFHAEGFKPAFQGIPPPETTQPTPPITQESAEKLIAMGMNPDLAKILDADSKNKFKADMGGVGGGTPKKKSKKKKKKGDSEKGTEAFEVEEVPLPMSIPLPDDVPLPPEPKKKKKKKRDKDLENVMFPPLPDVEPLVGPAPKPATPPIPVLQPEESGPAAAESSVHAMPQLPPEGSTVPSHFQQHLTQTSQSPILQPQLALLGQDKSQAEQTQVQQPSQKQSIAQPFFTGQPVLDSIQSPMEKQLLENSISGQIPQGVPAVSDCMGQEQIVPQVSLQLTTSIVTQPLAVQQVPQGQGLGVASLSADSIKQSVIQNQIGHAANSQQVSQGVSVSQISQTTVQQSSVRRSRFDPNWTPAVPIVQPVQPPELPVTMQQAAVALSSAQIPQLQQQMMFQQSALTSAAVQSSTAIQQEVCPVVKIQQPVAEKPIDQTQLYQPSQPTTVQNSAQDAFDVNTESISGQPTVPAGRNVDTLLQENMCVDSEPIESTGKDEPTAMETDVTETAAESSIMDNENQKSQVDESYIYFENKAGLKEDMSAESQIPKEPVTASQLLEKFKQKQQLKKTDSKSDLTKFPVALPTPLAQKTASKEDIKIQEKGQGKFTFAIRKLKQLEAEKEEEEKQVLTALSTEDQKKEASSKDVNEKDTLSEKLKVEKLSKEREAEVKVKSLFKERKKKSKTKSPERKSRSRSDSREKRKHKKQRSNSRERSKSRDRRKSRDRSKSRGRKSRSRDSRSKERQRRSRSKKKEKSLSPWRKDREFFRRYGRFPRPGEADNITYESSSSRDRGRFNDRNTDRSRGNRSATSRRSRDRSRDRSKDRWSRDRESRDRRSRDIESRDQRSAERESRDRRSRDRSRDRDANERSRDNKDRKKKREKDRKNSKGSEERDVQRSKERKYKEKDKKKKSRKDIKDESSSLSESSSDSDSENDKSKQKKKSKEIRNRSSSVDSNRKSKHKDRSASHDKRESKSKDTPMSIEVDYAAVKIEPVDQMEVESQLDNRKDFVSKEVTESREIDIFEDRSVGVENKMEILVENRENVEIDAGKQPEGFKKKGGEKVERSYSSSEEEHVQSKSKYERMSYSPEDSDNEKSKRNKYVEDERETSKQEKDRYRGKDKEKRKDKYIENPADEHPEKEERKVVREEKGTDYYRNDREEYKRSKEDRYRENRDRPARYKETKEDKYRREFDHRDKKEKTKYDKRVSDSESEDERDRRRKHKDYNSDSEENYRSSRKDEGRQRRYDDRQSRPENVEHTVTKSKWDSGSESGDDYERTHNEELPARSSSNIRSRKEDMQPSTSMSGTVKLEIDISKINQLKLLNKMMKAKQQRDSVSDQSSDSSDEYDSKLKKKQKKDKQSKKKSKKDKKRHADTDSENEDSPVKQKKKKKTKKKKKNYDEESDDEVDAQRKEKRKKKEKHASSDSDISSADEKNTSKRYREVKKGKKFDSESDDSVTKSSTFKNKKSKERDNRRFDSSHEDFGRRKRSNDKQTKSTKYQSESEGEMSVRRNRDKQKPSRDEYRDAGKKSKDKISRRDYQDQSEEENRYGREREKQKRHMSRDSESADDDTKYSRQRKRSKEKLKKEIKETRSLKKGKGSRQSNESDISDDTEGKRRNKKARDKAREESGSEEEYKRKKRGGRGESDEKYERKKIRSKEGAKYESGDSDDKFSEIMKGIKQYKENYMDKEERCTEDRRRKRSKSHSNEQEMRRKEDRNKQTSESNSESDHGAKPTFKLSKEKKVLQKDKLISEEKRSSSKEKRNVDDYLPEKSRKRSRSQSSHSKSRSRSRSKILKSGKQRKRYSSESDFEADQRHRRVHRKEEESSSDEEHSGRKPLHEYRTSINKDSRKKQNRDSESPNRERYEKVNRSPKRVEEIVVKDKHRKDREEHYDEDYKSRRKREYDKNMGKTRYSSSFSGNTSSSSTDSESDSEKERRRSKKTVQKNAEAGTGSKMGPVPGTPQTAENTSIEVNDTHEGKCSRDNEPVPAVEKKAEQLEHSHQTQMSVIKTHLEETQLGDNDSKDTPEVLDSNTDLIFGKGAQGHQYDEKTSKKQSKKKERKEKDKKKHKKKKKKKKKKHSESHADKKDPLNSSTESFQSGDKENIRTQTQSQEQTKPETKISKVGFDSKFCEEKVFPENQEHAEKKQASLLVDYESDDDSSSTDEEINASSTKKEQEQTDTNQKVTAIGDNPTPTDRVEPQKMKARISFRLSLDSDSCAVDVKKTDTEVMKKVDLTVQVEENEEKNRSKDYLKTANEIDKDDVGKKTDKNALYDPFEMPDESSGSDTDISSKQAEVSAKQLDKLAVIKCKEDLPVNASTSRTIGKPLSILPDIGCKSSVTNANMQPVMYPYQAVHSVVSPVSAPAPVGVPAPVTLQSSQINTQTLPGTLSTTVCPQVLPLSSHAILPPPTVTIPSLGARTVVTESNVKSASATHSPSANAASTETSIVKQSSETPLTETRTKQIKIKTFIPNEAHDKDSKVKIKSRWDTEKHTEKEKHAQPAVDEEDDLYDPFSIDVDSSPSSPKMETSHSEKQSRSKFVESNLKVNKIPVGEKEDEENKGYTKEHSKKIEGSLEKIPMPEVSTSLPKPDKVSGIITSSKETDSKTSSKPEAPKITMKFTMGKKVIGKSAIMAEEAEETDEVSRMPKLKLSTPDQAVSTVPVSTKKSFIDSKRALKKSIQAAEFIERELERSELKNDKEDVKNTDKYESDECDSKHRSFRRNIKTEPEEKLKYHERSRKRSQSLDRSHSTERQDSESKKERSRSREKRSSSGIQKSSISRESKQISSGAKKQDASGDRSVSRDRKSFSRERKERSRSISLERAWHKRSSSRDRQRGKRVSKERSVSRERRHRSQSKERRSKRSYSRERHRKRNKSGERRQSRSKTPERRHRSYRDESFDFKDRRHDKNVSSVNRRSKRRKRSKTRSSSPSAGRERKLPRKRPRSKKQSSSEESDDTSDSESSSSSSDDDDSLFKKELGNPTGQRESIEKTTVEKADSMQEKVKPQRLDSVDGSTQDKAVENEFRSKDSPESASVPLPVSSENIARQYNIKEKAERKNKHTNIFIEVDEEVSFKTPASSSNASKVIKMSEELSATKHHGRSSLFEKFSPEKMIVSLESTQQNKNSDEDEQKSENSADSNNFKGSWEKTPTGLFKYSPKKISMEEKDVKPVEKLFDISPNKAIVTSKIDSSESEKRTKVGSFRLSDERTVEEYAEKTTDNNITEMDLMTKDTSEQPLAKRLTRKQAAEQKLVLPPVMTKDMPSRGRKGRKLSEDIKLLVTADSYLEKSEENSNDSGTEEIKGDSSKDRTKENQLKETSEDTRVTVEDVQAELLLDFKRKTNSQKKSDESASSVPTRDYSEIKSDKIRLKVEDIPMPPSSIDENENTVRSKSEDGSFQPKEATIESNEIVDMELDEPDETLQNIEIIHLQPKADQSKETDRKELKDFQSLPANESSQQLRNEEAKKLLEETFHKDTSVKGFSLKLIPNVLKKPKQKLTNQMLDDVFDTEATKPEKPKLSFKLSDEPVKPLSFGSAEFHITPKPVVVTAAVASFKPLADERNSTESVESQAESKVEDIGPSQVEETTLHIDKSENENTDGYKATDENIADGNGSVETLSSSSVQGIQVIGVTDQAQTPNTEEVKKAENMLKIPQISPEQIGKAIQVIGQENLRRLEVLQRESAKLLQGKKIEVVGQRPDTSKSTSSTFLPGSSTLHQDAYDNPNLNKRYDDADLNQLEKEKQELLQKLNTQDNPTFEVGGSFSEDQAFQEPISSHTNTSTVRETEESAGSSQRDRDRYDSKRERRDDDHDDRRSGRNNRDWRRSRKSRSRDRSRDRDSYRGRDRGRSRDRSRDRERSRDRKRKKRHRDEDRHRARRKSRSRSWSREKRSWSRERRSRSRDRRSRSRDRRSRSRGRVKRSHSRDRRSRSRERRSRSRDRRRSRRSRSRSRDRRSHSRDRFKKHDRSKDDKPKRESALEKFEKELAEKKKVLLQPVGSSPIMSTPSQPVATHAGQQMVVLQDPNSQFVDAQGQFIQLDPAAGAPHFLPQPFPVHQQQMPVFPMSQPQSMPDQPFPGYPADPNMFHPQPPMGPQFYTEGMPQHMTPASMAPGQPFPGPHIGPGFVPGMFPSGPIPHSLDPNVMPVGQHPVHMEHHPVHMRPGPDTNPQIDVGPGFPAKTIAAPISEQPAQDTMCVAQPHSLQGIGHAPEKHIGKTGLPSGSYQLGLRHSQEHLSGTGHKSVTDSQREAELKSKEPEEDLDRTPIPDFNEDDEEALEFKHGFGGPGIPGHPSLKAVFQNDEEPNQKREKKRKGKRVSRFEPRQDDVEIKVESKHEAEDICKNTVEKPSEAEKNEEGSEAKVSKSFEELTGFGKWQVVNPEKKIGAVSSELESSGSGQLVEAKPGTPQSQSEDMSDTDAGSGKPMKVKSRWRRASEAEVPPPPPPPNKKVDEKLKEADKEEMEEKEEEEEIPIDFDLIDENVYLAERKRSKQMREVRRMVCDCTTCKEDREMGYEACGEDCLNRMLFIECGSKCPCGEYCMNKRFQKKQNAIVAPFKTSWKGHGLKALEDLEPGQFVMEYVGEVLDYPLFKKRSKQYSKAGQQHFYFMAINPEEIVDATVMGNISRFINHSCDPNCETQKWTVNGTLRVGFFVKKPIQKDEEITFDYKYEVYGKEAQKCFCGTSICRGWLGGDKRMELRSTRRTTSVDELEKKKKELFDDSDKLEEEIERMSELHEGLRNKNDVLNMCRLMVRAEDPEHRLQILRVLDNTEEPACLRLFLDYHGLPLLWCWMADLKLQVSDLKHMMLKVLKKLPITNKTILQDSKILDIVTKWSSGPGDGLDPTESSDALETTQEITDTDNTENDDESVSTPPVTSNKNPVSILASIRDKKSVKKSVKFAEVESSSDSESRASASESDFLGESVEGDVSSSSQTGSSVKTRRQLRELRRQVLERDSVEGQPESVSDVTQSTDADSSSENQSESSQKELKDQDVKESEEKSVTLSETVEVKEDRTMELSEETEPESKTSVGISEKETEELEMIVRAAEIRNLASDLLEHWSTLKELYKIPKKQVLEERKRTERELDSNYENLAKIEERKKKVSGWDTVKARKRKRELSFKDDTDDSDSNTSRKYLLATPPRMSKSERRQRFEAQVKAQDEYQRAQEQFQQEQYEHEQMIQQQHQRQLMQDPAFWYYATQDPNFLPSIGIDPHQFLQQLAMDPVLLQQLMATIPNFQQQLEHLTFMYQQAVLQASQYEMSGQPEQPTLQEDEPMTEQHIAFLQQVEAFKQQHLEPKSVMPAIEEEDIPPPPSPPKGKAIVLPPNWKTAKDSEGKMYYYHTVTRQTQWDPPNIDTGEHADDMDLGTPTQDDTASKGEQKEEKEKTTTAAADTSSEMSRKLKEQFKTKMSSWIVICLNPFRKPDCKLGRVSSTEDFKHLARKLTHHVMAKELKHCRHVEDLEVNENVKSKAKDFVKKYMAKFGASYKRSGNSPSYD